jgi:hypothetical protein
VHLPCRVDGYIVTVVPNFKSSKKPVYHVVNFDFFWFVETKLNLGPENDYLEWNRSYR